MLLFLDYCQVQDGQTKPMCQDWGDMGCRLLCISIGLGFIYLSQFFFEAKSKRDKNKVHLGNPAASNF